VTAETEPAHTTKWNTKSTANIKCHPVVSTFVSGIRADRDPSNIGVRLDIRDRVADLDELPEFRTPPFDHLDPPVALVGRAVAGCGS
jgi:hypothetical protein